jgi:hypothetical protein
MNPIPTLRARIARDLALAGVVPEPVPQGNPDGHAAIVAELRRPTFRVWSGASDGTVHGSRAANYAFRAWHDVHHAIVGADFSPEGERELARYACTLFPGRRMVAVRRILDAEVWGQVAYFVRRRTFPVDQLAFVRAWVVDGPDRATSVAF